MPNVHKLDGGRVAVNIDEGPEGTSGFHAAEEDAFLFAVDAEVDIAGGGHVIEEDGVLAAEALRKGLRPIAGLISKVGAGVLG